MKVLIERFWQNENQTEGMVRILNDTYKVLLKGYCIELPDRDNEKNISRIPSKIYKARKRWSQKFSWHIELLDVPNRSYILIHSGNYFTQTEGCILVGSELKDINADFNVDAINSRVFLNKMLEILPDNDLFEVIIIDDIGVEL